ncbi:MAG: 4Fe-4S binding protein [Deltaproteobacteria bacterium]|nr:4Fe-4S binding protein [Deltaproteobacteria bacterium]
MSYTITEKCTGCGVCVRHCPTEAISGEKKKQHTIDKDKCIECGVCGRICPAKDAVLDQGGVVCKRVKKSEWPKPVVIRSLCTACSMCVDICPFNCLGITDPPDFPRDFTAIAYLKDTKGCVGCTQCADICPQEAIYLAVPSG